MDGEQWVRFDCRCIVRPFFAAYFAEYLAKYLFDFSEPTQLDVGTAYKGSHGFDTSAHEPTSFLRVREMSFVNVGIEKAPHASTESVDGGSFGHRCQWEIWMRLGWKVTIGRRLVASHYPFPNISPPLLLESAGDCQYEGLRLVATTNV